MRSAAGLEDKVELDTHRAALAQRRVKADNIVKFGTVFFLGWVAATGFYGTDQLRAISKMWGGGQVALQELTNRLGACETNLAVLRDTPSP
jgi:hypothetical protein